LLERFLARLSGSKQHNRFIFKGGLLLAQYLEIGRETIDADFLVTKIKSEAAAIEVAVKEIIAVVVNDSAVFTWDSIEELTQPHMAYPGFRVSLHATYGKMKDKIQLDIGVGDVVKPVEEDFKTFIYKGKPIFEGEISLQVYPVESIFAEKLETVISKGAINSRMKDFHDLVLMVREKGLIDRETIKATVAATFKNRKTELRIPIVFDEEGIETLQRLWTRHLNGLGVFKEKLGLPEKILDVLSELNGWLKRFL
jgi:predicted nucleotidyltransferase component of viral defense system